MKRPRFRGFSKELKAAADQFARDIAPGGNAERANKLIHELGSGDWYLVFRVVRGVTASQLQAEEGVHKRNFLERIRSALTRVAKFYGLPVPRDGVVEAAELHVQEMKARGASPTSRIN